MYKLFLKNQLIFRKTDFKLRIQYVNFYFVTAFIEVQLVVSPFIQWFPLTKQSFLSLSWCCVLFNLWRFFFLQLVSSLVVQSTEIIVGLRTILQLTRKRMAVF